MLELKRRYRRRIGALLIEMHRVRRLTPEQLGQRWKIHPDRIRLWMGWYGIIEIPLSEIRPPFSAPNVSGKRSHPFGRRVMPVTVGRTVRKLTAKQLAALGNDGDEIIPVRPKREKAGVHPSKGSPAAPAPSPTPQPPTSISLTSGATGTVILAVANLWPQLQDWNAVAERFSATPDQLRCWMDEHRASLSPGVIPREALLRLFKGEYSAPHVEGHRDDQHDPAEARADYPFLTPHLRPPGITLSPEATTAIAAACEAAECPENQLLVDQFDADRLDAVASQFALTVPTYLALVREYNGGSLPETAQQEDEW